jgi:hypothetical protein
VIALLPAIADYTYFITLFLEMKAAALIIRIVKGKFKNI